MTKKDDDGFLTRWSRLKSMESDPIDSDPIDSIGRSETKDLATTTEPEPIDIPIWQQEGVEPGQKRQALTALFKQDEFKDVDHMNEYDEDFTRFSGLGDIVTEEMKRMVRIVEQRTRPELDEIEPQDDTSTKQAEQHNNIEQDNEEDKLA